MKENTLRNNFAVILIILGLAVCAIAGVKMYQNDVKYNKCLDSIEGTDAECDSCWIVTHNR